MAYELKNATIQGTRLGVACSDHGILSFMITLDYGNSGQGFGQIVLDTVNPDYRTGDHAVPSRIPTPLAAGLLLGINNIFGCDWEDLKGKPCRAYASWSNVFALGHFLSDKWLWLRAEREFVVTSFEEMVAAARKDREGAA